MRRVLTGTIRIRGGGGGVVAPLVVPNVTARIRPKRQQQGTLLSGLPQRALVTIRNHNSSPPPTTTTTTTTTTNPRNQTQMQPRSSAKKKKDLDHQSTVSATNDTAPTTIKTRWMVGLYSWRHHLFASSMRTTRSSLDRVGATATTFDASSVPPPRVEFTTFDTESQAHEWYQAHDHCSRILWQQQQPQQSNDCQHTISDHSPPPPPDGKDDNGKEDTRNHGDHSGSVWDRFASTHTLVACSTAFWDVQGLGLATLWLGPPPVLPPANADSGTRKGNTTTPATTTTTCQTQTHDYPAVSRQAIVQALQQGQVPFVPPQRTPSVQWSVKWSLQAVTATIRAASRSSKMKMKQTKACSLSFLPSSTKQSGSSGLSWPFRNDSLKKSRLARTAACNRNNNNNNDDVVPSLSSSSLLLSNHHRRAMAHFGTAPHRNASLCYFPVDTFPHVRGHVALTLDDAPCRFHSPNPTTACSASLVPAVRRLLHQYDAKATFMVVGHWVRNSTYHQSSLISLIQDGHELANHGMLDQSYEFALPHEFGQAVHECQDLLESLYGEAAAGITSADHYSSVPRLRWFRPPHGRYTQAMETVLDEQGLLPVLCDAYASCPIVQDGPFVAQQLLHQVQDGSILLLHMPERHVRPWCWTALQLVLQHLKQHHWKVVTVSHLAHLARVSIPEPPQQAAAAADGHDVWKETTRRRPNKPVWWQMHPQFQPALQRKQPSTPNDPVPFSSPSLPLLVSSPKIWDEWKTRSLDLSSLLFRRKNQQEEGP